jgi:hypothetical protein
VVAVTSLSCTEVTRDEPGGATSASSQQPGGAGPSAGADDAAGADARPVACDEAVRPEEGDPVHLDPADPTLPDELYADRPPASGPHLAAWLEAGVYDGPIDERAVVHNLEHGAVWVAYDAAALDAGSVAELERWAGMRNDAGLANDAGAGLVVAPYDEPMDAAVALRGWLIGLDCDGVDLSRFDTFLREHFGPAGQAPERGLAPSFDAVLRSI